MESRVRDLVTVRALRSARVDAVAASAAGELASLLASTDGFTRAVYVVKILDVHPGLGKVAGRRLLAEVGVEPLARISDLTPGQTSRILEAVGRA